MTTRFPYGLGGILPLEKGSENKRRLLLKNRLLVVVISRHTDGSYDLTIIEKSKTAADRILLERENMYGESIVEFTWSAFLMEHPDILKG